MRRLLEPSPGLAHAVWRDADAEALLHPDATRARVLPGLVLVGIVVEVGERAGPTTLTVPFAVGTERTPAGMVIGAERRARGDELVTGRWGKYAVAAAYRSLLLATAAVAAGAGWDLDGAPLVTGALTAEPHRLNIWAQARFESDRVRRA